MRKSTLFYTCLAIVIFVSFLNMLLRPIVLSARVDGDSMSPTIFHNDYILFRPIESKSDISYNSIIAFTSDSEKLIKRVVGIPGDKVAIINNELYINDFLFEVSTITDKTKVSPKFKDYILSDDEYFVLGDNRANSIDSRVLGPIKFERIFGVAKFRFWPISDFTSFD